ELGFDPRTAGGDPIHGPAFEAVAPDVREDSMRDGSHGWGRPMRPIEFARRGRVGDRNRNSRLNGRSSPTQWQTRESRGNERRTARGLRGLGPRNMRAERVPEL